jgi:hypothetical protein
MLLKILNGFSQAAIIVLAFVLIVTITNKHSSNLALEDFQTQVNKRFEDDKKYYDGRIKTVQDNLNTYQQTREARAQLYSKRLDELYDLYKKDPIPIQNTNKVAPSVDGNFSYLEVKANKIDEKVDNLDSKVSTKISIIEKKLELVEQQNKVGTKVINNNQSSAVVNMPVPN